MTRRVVECRTAPLDLDGPRSRPRARVRPPAGRGFAAALLVALVVVPLAGAAEPPVGWTVAALTAVLVLLLHRWLHGRARWGWLSVFAAISGLFVPRDQLAAIGPAFFVATTLFCVLWLANRGTRRAQPDDRPLPGTPEREAQQLMGFTGERHVGAVLAHELDDSYVLLNGLKLTHGAGDIDHLVVGPNGVFLLETKTMAGRIVCEADGTWTRTRLGRAGTQYAAFIGDPAAQAHRNIMAVRNCLRRRVPWLFDGHGVWIEGLLVFPHPRTDLDTEHSPLPALRLEHVSRYIHDHLPRRRLMPNEVEAIVAALLSETDQRVAQSAQALVEVALALPVVLGLLFGTVALSRVVQAQTAIVVVAHEAARAGALADSPVHALGRMQERALQVAPGLGLDASQLVLTVDVSHFDRSNGRVAATAQYTVDLGTLPFVGSFPEPTVRAEHVEWIDPFRAGITVPPTRTSSP